MPGTLSGLLFVFYALIPGYCYYAVRRRIAPTRRVSTVVEAANVIVMAMITNALILVIYGILQLVPWIRDHSPSVVHLLRDADDYLLHSNSRLAYVGIWAAVLLIGSSTLAIALACPIGSVRKLLKSNSARILEESVWDHVFFAEAPDDSITYLECYLHDGSYTAGRLAWYNSDIDDSLDRDLVLSRPITVTKVDGSELVEPGYDQFVVVSARDIRHIIVTYVAQSAIEAERELRSRNNSDTEELDDRQTS